jgi:hypothetical protein
LDCAFSVICETPICNDSVILVIGPDGNGYFLANGNLYANTPTANYEVLGVQSFGFRSDGLMYVWHTNQDLTLNTLMRQQVSDFGVVQCFSQGLAGTGYFLQNGNLIQNTPSGNVTLDSNVAQFAIDGAGNVIALDQMVTIHSYLQGAVHNIAPGGDETVGTLVRFVPGSTVRQILDSYVRTFTVDGAGYVLAVESYIGHYGTPFQQNGYLYYRAPIGGLIVDGPPTLVRFAPGSLGNSSTGVRKYRRGCLLRETMREHILYWRAGMDQAAFLGGFNASYHLQHHCFSLCGHFAADTLAQQLQQPLRPGDAARLKGMRVAVADIEAGKLILRLPDSSLPAGFYEQERIRCRV